MLKEIECLAFVFLTVCRGEIYLMVHRGIFIHIRAIFTHSALAVQKSTTDIAYKNSSSKTESSNFGQFITKHSKLTSCLVYS